MKSVDFVEMGFGKGMGEKTGRSDGLDGGGHGLIVSWPLELIQYRLN